MSDDEIKNLCNSIKSKTKESYELGGATLKNYFDVEGNKGDFTKFFKVYQKKNDPEGREVVRELTKDKRATFWSPQLQK